MTYSPSASLLIVDDQPNNLMVLRAVLEPLGHRLVEARSGREALRHLLVDEFALVLIDVDMPVMDGLETASVIKQRERSRYTPIIFITAKGVDDPSFLQAYTMGAVDFLAKPINATVLRSKVTVFVELYEQRRHIAEQAELLRKSEHERAMREQEVVTSQLEKKHLAALASLLERQRQLLADVLVSVTEGRLRLVDRRRDLPHAYSPTGKPITLARNDSLRELRQHTLVVAKAQEMPDDRCHDLITAVSEAAMNAVVHGGGGKAKVCASNDGVLQVWISDRGPGISLEKIPRATLERGFSTSGTLGHGFWLILNTTDRVFLHTGDSGTTVVIEQYRTPPETAWM